jgi:hypothetical protein
MELNHYRQHFPGKVAFREYTEHTFAVSRDGYLEDHVHIEVGLFTLQGVRYLPQEVRF